MELEEDSEISGDTACYVGGRVFGNPYGRARRFALKRRALPGRVGVFENEMVFERCFGTNIRRSASSNQGLASAKRVFPGAS